MYEDTRTCICIYISVVLVNCNLTRDWTHDKTNVWKKLRGHHVYKETWTPYISEELTTNVEDENLFVRHAIAVLKNGEIVGHHSWILLASTLNSRAAASLLFASATATALNF